ncbi:unnamed protein product [Adineta steineri]|uniref:MACPF-like domain-containing protein n=1 Tax=Adineta steineri TaxID=433720 RepID=A0A813QH19_9BILA|nr:unnamed protein product [Adineta steineri]CAF0924204.1 unnamed protein product [Adineta steineri]
MATGQSPTEQISIIRLDIDGEKYSFVFDHSRSAAELRSKLSTLNYISSNTCFLNAEDYRVHIEDEKLMTIKGLLTEKKAVRLITDKDKSTPIPIPDIKNKALGRKSDLNYAQTLSRSTRTSFREIKVPGSTPTRLENEIILATNLNLDTWQQIFHNCNLFRGVRMDEKTPKRAFKPIFKFRENNEDFPLFQVTDNSNIRIYMKDKEMQSSFLSSQFFDGIIEFSNPYIGFGINGEYSNSKSTTITERQVYLTSCFNFPRVTLELDSSYLEPTPQFIEAIDVVLLLTSRNEQIFKLKEVLSIYGHVYPKNVVLGGHIYHTEVHHNKEKAEEAQKRINAELSLSASIFKPAKIHVDGGSDDQSQSKSSDQTSLLNFEAVGGDTLNNRDPTLWTNTVADPSLWRIIEQDNYQSVITLFDRERQKKLQKIIKCHKAKVSKWDKWKQNAITVIGENGKGQKLNQLNGPYGIFIDENTNISIADWLNHRIVEWKCNAKEGQIIAGGNDKGTRMDQLSYPQDVIVDQHNRSIIIADTGNRRVIQWLNQNQQIIIDNIDCFGLVVDKNEFLYVSDCEKNEVRRWKMGEYNEGIVVAGGNGKGDRLNLLNNPTFIFVDEDQSIYVSDLSNHRVMKWRKGAKEGRIVAGGNGKGRNLNQLSSPQGVIVDDLGRIYVADSNNHRVMRWCEGKEEGEIIVGGNGEGNQANQLNLPMGLSFDDEGNLYVADCVKYGIQKFEIIL